MAIMVEHEKTGQDGWQKLETESVDKNKTDTDIAHITIFSSVV